MLTENKLFKCISEMHGGLKSAPLAPAERWLTPKSGGNQRQTPAELARAPSAGQARRESGGLTPLLGEGRTPGGMTTSDGRTSAEVRGPRRWTQASLVVMSRAERRGTISEKGERTPPSVGPKHDRMAGENCASGTTPPVTAGEVSPLVNQRGNPAR